MTNVAFHVAYTSYIHERPLNSDAGPGRVERFVKAPTEALCGAKLGDLRAIMPHDHPGACRSCLQLLPSRRGPIEPFMTRA